MIRNRYELSQLRCFVAVAEELNFRRAAERLNMTQPPLSRQIKLLEHAVGLLLLERTNRQVKLTPAGESFYQSAADMLQRAEVAVLKARQAERGEAGSIALGFVPSAGLDFIPLILHALAQKKPDAVLNATEMMSYEIVEAQQSGQLDMGLTRMERASRGVQRERVVSESFVLAVPADHALATAPAPSLSDLEDLPFIGFSADRGGFMWETHRTMFNNAGVMPRYVQHSSQTHAVVALVNRGIGSALVPASARVLQMSGVCYRDIEIPAPFRSDLFLIYRDDRLSPLQIAVRDLIRDTLAPFNV